MTEMSTTPDLPVTMELPATNAPLVDKIQAAPLDPITSGPPPDESPSDKEQIIEPVTEEEEPRTVTIVSVDKTDDR
jgi:hypothetical protein